ncbi:methyltransferase domain-containing protein [Streptomyces sp. IBSBF 2953]|nr:methyltransferase domain-containing protein [Streptomyces hayashii]
MTTSNTFRTVMNEQRDKALWPAGLPLPSGWVSVGSAGSEESCHAALRALPTAQQCAEALRRHPLVAQTWVHPLRTDTGLVVVPDFDKCSAATDQDAVLDAWALVFDDMYADKPEDQLVGWIDSATGAPLDTAAMGDWVAATVERIRPLPRTRVLEIGSGTGMIARGVLALGGIERYLATDVSESALRNLHQTLQPAAVVAHRVGDAHRIAAELDEEFDLVLLNSVCQYFPSTRYLAELLTLLAPQMASGGHILLGDLRHAGLEPVLAAERARMHQPDADPAELAALAQELHRESTELAVHPGWAERLTHRIPGVTAVDTGPRLGQRATEMTRFRFDALLHFGCPAPPAPSAPAQDGAMESPDWEQLILRSSRPFRFTGIPNARLVDTPGATDPDAMTRTAARARGTLGLRYADDSGSGALDVFWSPEPSASRCDFSHPRLHAATDITPAFPPRTTQHLTTLLTAALREACGTLDPALDIVITEETPAEWRS